MGQHQRERDVGNCLNIGSGRPNAEVAECVFGPRPPTPAVIDAIGFGVNITHKADMARGRSSADNGCVEGTQGQFAR
jgi:hypothetical protein